MIMTASQWQSLVKELNKYLKHHHQAITGNKSVKVATIVAHVLKQDLEQGEENTNKDSDESSSGEDDDSDQDEEVVVNIIENSSSTQPMKKK